MNSICNECKNFIFNIDEMGRGLPTCKMGIKLTKHCDWDNSTWELHEGIMFETCWKFIKARFSHSQKNNIKLIFYISLVILLTIFALWFGEKI